METLFARKIVGEPVVKAEEVVVEDPEDVDEAMAALVSGIEGLGMGEAAAPAGAVSGWGGEPMEGGARRRRSHKHRKSHRRSAHRRSVSRKSHRKAHRKTRRHA